jgi:PAS domain S-box-containing protein
MNNTVYILGVLLQAIAAIVALSQVRKAPRKLPWLLIGLSSLLIVARRVATLGEFMSSGREMAVGEILTLIISLLFFMGVILMTRMFTEIREEKEARQRSEERFRALAEHAPIGIYITDKDGACKYVNQRWCEAAGLLPEEAHGQGWVKGLHPDDRVSISEKWTQSMLSGGSWGFEYRFQNRAGHVTWVYGTAAPLHTVEGSVTEYVGANVDITDRKLVEETMQKTQEILHSLFNAIYESVCVIERDGKVLSANVTFARRLGKRVDDCVGQSVFDLFPAELVASRKAMVEKVVLTRQPITFEDERLGRHLSHSLSPVLATDGSVDRIAIYAMDITERKQAEEVLRDAAHEWSTSFDAMPDGVSIHALDHTILRVNQTLCQLLGKKSEELVGKKCYDVFHGTDDPIACCPIEMTRKTRSKAQAEFFETALDKWLAVSSSPIFDDSGQLIRLVHVASDITGRRQMDDSLRQMTERLELAQRASKAGAWDWNIRTGHIVWTPQMFNILGLDPTKTAASFEAWERAVHPDDLKTARLRIEQALKQKSPLNSDYRIVLSDGRIRWINAVGEGKYDDQGNPAQMVGICVDITDRKLAEEALKISEAKLTEAQRMAHIGSWQWDMIANTVEWSKEMYRLFDIAPDDFDGKPDTLLKVIHPDDLASFTHNMNSNLSGGNSPSLEYRVIHKDGSIHHMFGEGRIEVDDTGRPVRSVGTVQDISDRKQSDEERRLLEEKLQRSEKMEALGTLAGGVAHDLNNVLGIVVGYAEMLLDGIEESSPIRSDVMRIMDGGERAAAIVQDLLTLARRGVQTKKVVNLNTAILECQKTPEFEKIFSFNRRIRLKTKLEADLLNIMGSPVHLGKTVINLVSNAVEAMPEGGLVTITTSSQYLEMPIYGYDEVREGDYVVLSVSDEGEGVAANDIKRIFEPFYTKKVMGKSGTGLGLAVVWGTVKDHHGYINIESEKGKGTTFTLYFPVTREDLSKEQISASISEYIGKQESILVVDDVEGQRELAARMLARLNYRVTPLSSGEEAVAYLKTNRVDLVVLDMIMDPGMDGLDTYKRILELHPRQKAIIVSGFSESERVLEAQALGAGTYVRKPFVLERLGWAVRKELDRKQATAISP